MPKKAHRTTRTMRPIASRISVPPSRIHHEIKLRRIVLPVRSPLSEQKLAYSTSQQALVRIALGQAPAGGHAGVFGRAFGPSLVLPDFWGL